MSTSRRRLTVFLIAGALLAGACSDGGGASEEKAAENPKEALTEALEAFGEYEGVTMEMTIEANPDDLVEADTPPEAAEALVNSSLTISGKGTTPEDTQAEVLVNIDGNEDAIAMRVIGSALYARAEVPELVETFGGDQAEIDAMVSQASAMGFGFVQDIVDGDWVGVEDVNEVTEQLGIPIQTPDPEAAAALQDKVVQILEQNADVTSEGSDDVGAHLVVSLPLKDTVTDLFDTLESLSGSPAGAFPDEQALGEIPDADIPLDVWVSDGRLVQIEADIVAIMEAVGEEAEDAPDEFAIRLAIDEFTDEVEAPDDFTPIDLSQILQGILGGTTGSESAGAGAAGGREVVVPELGLACSDLAGVPPDQIKTFLEASGEGDAYDKVKAACPELF